MTITQDEADALRKPLHLDTACRPGGLAQAEQEPPCPTCEALARTVMLDQTSHDTTPQRDLESTTDMMMELADRLGELPDDIDPRAWEHLLVYAPKHQPLTDEQIYEMVAFARAIEAAHGIGDKT